MTTTPFYRLPSLTVLDVSGADAVKIVNNLTTNEVSSLEDRRGCEAFVTDVKGKTIGHVSVFRVGELLRMIGPAGQSERIAAHLDRYTIVEDVVVKILDDSFTAFALPSGAVSKINPDRQGDRHSALAGELTSLNAWGYDVGWLGEHSMVLLSPTDTAGSTRQQLIERGLFQSEEASFHQARTLAGFPWIGIDFDDKNLPQEVNRNVQAISFTKGCYLGQETVARLDAMGQVQKKLVRWRTSGAIPDPNVEVVSDGKTVGRLTSIAPGAENEAVAIGIARRSHFDDGSSTLGSTDAGDFSAVVESS